MTTTDIAAIKRTWRLLQNINPMLIADLFYSKLFIEKPGLRKMFPENMEGQYRKLMDMLDIIVKHLEHPDEVQAALSGMAQRHLSYGVKAIHYKLVGDALLWTLQRGLGTDWTPETKQAWLNCYTLLSSMMQQEAQHH